MADDNKILRFPASSRPHARSLTLPETLIAKAAAEIDAITQSGGEASADSEIMFIGTENGNSKFTPPQLWIIGALQQAINKGKL